MMRSMKRLSFGLVLAVGATACGGFDLAEAEGTWQTSCNDNVIDTVTIKDGVMAWTMPVFEQEDCSGISKFYTLSGAFSAKIGDEAEGVDGAYELDRILTEFSMVYHTDEAAAVGNTIQTGGYTDWQKDVPKSLLGVDQEGCTLNRGDALLDLIKLDGDKLFFGEYVETEAGTCILKTQRPDKLSSVSYTKQ